MAYTPTVLPACPTAGAQRSIRTMAIKNTGSEVNYRVQVPMDQCDLVYACAWTYDTANTDAHEIDLELNSAGGTELMTCTLVSGTGVGGSATDFTYTTEASAKNLNTSNYINIEADGDGTGDALVEMWFE